tara:strand:- start:87 stop:1430 length:1344 start_codon:yes stop_codon:yes gene_type:complete
MKIIHGDCIQKLKELNDNSIDSIVTDPPYGLSFMGKKWDYDVPSQEIWEECYRVLKPGGHLLSFAGSRTYHRMAIRIEDAGFEIRDQIMWIYGSGFPKSMNIGLQLDKKLGNERELVERPKSEQRPNADKNRDKNKDVGGFAMSDNKYKSVGNSEWEGWGTALKPAHEPIVMARKPLSEKTVVDNVLEWGTGGINIDGSRIGTEQRTYKGMSSKKPEGAGTFRDDNWIPKDIENTVEGRFPANLIFDEEAGKILDEQSGISKSTGGRSGNKEGVGQNGIYNQYKGEVRDENPGLGDIGGASRFFYCPKTSKTDRNEGLDEFQTKQTLGGGGISKVEKAWIGTKSASGKYGSLKAPSKNNHPTVKPTDLMLYLIRMVTPKGGTTLDPFMGSGSTGKAAIRGGFDFVGIEREQEYKNIAEARIQYEIDNPYNEEKGERIKINKNANKFW